MKNFVDLFTVKVLIKGAKGIFIRAIATWWRPCYVD